MINLRSLLKKSNVKNGKRAVMKKEPNLTSGRRCSNILNRMDNCQETDVDADIDPQRGGETPPQWERENVPRHRCLGANEMTQKHNLTPGWRCSNILNRVKTCQEIEVAAPQRGGASENVSRDHCVPDRNVNVLRRRRGAELCWRCAELSRGARVLAELTLLATPSDAGLAAEYDSGTDSFLISLGCSQEPRVTGMLGQQKEGRSWGRNLQDDSMHSRLEAEQHLSADDSSIETAFGVDLIMLAQPEPRSTGCDNRTPRKSELSMTRTYTRPAARPVIRARDRTDGVLIIDTKKGYEKITLNKSDVKVAITQMDIMTVTNFGTKVTPVRMLIEVTIDTVIEVMIEVEIEVVIEVASVVKMAMVPDNRQHGTEMRRLTRSRFRNLCAYTIRNLLCLTPIGSAISTTSGWKNHVTIDSNTARDDGEDDEECGNLTVAAPEESGDGTPSGVEFGTLAVSNSVQRLERQITQNQRGGASR